MKNIFYIEDDIDIAKSVKTYLESKGFFVSVFSEINSTKNSIKNKIPALCLIDINLCDGNGTDLCKWIRKSYPYLPVIFITVKNETSDIVSGFDIGADDYITKPFELDILYSRICALLRRSKNSDKIYICNDILLDENKYKVFLNDKEITLSAMEYQLLSVLMQNKNATVTRQQLLKSLWDDNNNFVNDNTLTVTMKRLREKLGNPSCIKTIRSFGYRMEDSYEEKD